MWVQPKYFEKRSNWETSEAKKKQFEKFLPIKLYCVIPTKQRQKDKSQLPTFIYNWTRSRRMKQVPSVTHAALAAGRMKYSNYSRLPHIMTGIQKLTCNRGGEMEKKEEPCLEDVSLTERKLDQNSMPFIFCGSLWIMFVRRISELHEKAFI